MTNSRSSNYSLLELYAGICTNNVDAVFVCLPNVAAYMTSIVKLSSIHMCRKDERQLFIIKSRLQTANVEMLKGHGILYIVV